MSDDALVIEYVAAYIMATREFSSLSTGIQAPSTQNDGEPTSQVDPAWKLWDDAQNFLSEQPAMADKARVAINAGYTGGPISQEQFFARS
ncbi:hypothetical protein ACFWD7_56990 [Streptomyces mirabilis]|uniref:hypothetical protein n=1 Tax=Streptomyces mirabilis TaxID=68239 RepID=UPI0036AE162E